MKNLIRKILKEEVVRKKIHMDLPNSVLKMNQIFKENGYELYVVGGAVRDLLYGNEPKDFDLATNAKPEEIKSILNMYRTIELGEQFGIVNVVTEDGQYEIATFRKDIGKGRRPDSVEFTTIDQDVKRRDLTINALFYDIDKGEVVDLVGGIGDIERNVVRTVGSAVERFDEDKLRVLRALRFAARVGSDVDKDIESAISKDKTTISGNGLPISQERIRDEFLKGIKQAQSVGYFTQLITKYNLWDWIFGRLVVTTEPLIETKEANVLIAVLLQSNESTLVEKTLVNKLKYTVDEVKEISFLIKFLQYGTDVYKLRERFEVIGISEETLRTFSNLMKIPNKIVDTFLEYKITTSGDDLIKKGFKGREIGQEKERIEKEKFLKLMNESKKKVSYSGVILNEESRKLLKKYIPHPKDWEFIGHHMTINMGPLKEESKPLLDQPFDLLVTHIGQTDKVVAVKVESEIKTQNKIPHITIAVNRMEGGKPVMSNDITEWSPIYPFEVEGKVEEISI
jgi:tRNA nucleotidyltransferase/poly(A) polymerase